MLSGRIRKEMQASHGKRVPAYVWVTLGVTLLTLLLHAIGMSGDLVNVALVYLFPVLVSAVYWGMGPAVYAASFSVIMFDFFFVPPYLSFTVEDLRYLISFAVYLAVAILTASLAGRLRQQLERVKAREATTNSLYALSRQMTAITDLNTLQVNIATQVSLTLAKPAAVYLPDGQGDLLVTSSSSPASEGEKDSWGMESRRLPLPNGCIITDRSQVKDHPLCGNLPGYMYLCAQRSRYMACSP